MSLSAIRGVSPRLFHPADDPEYRFPLPRDRARRRILANILVDCQAYAGCRPWKRIPERPDSPHPFHQLYLTFYCGMQATAHLQYGGKNYVRGGTKHYSGASGDIFTEGAAKNVAAFYQNIVEGHHENLSAQRAVDGTLTAILGREAAARRCFLTMGDLIKENKRLAVNLEGMKD